ncbi:hypothetical protein L598_000800000950 [Mesorhizobium sp. J18]|uniref:hypothetical protein n=1 Tax=Mesorhizobium sp. J18 TaxID=935263 RepID=UPI00119937EB|nr:hypothetical protein [Mesorhizobium sp. J18]TWG89631.1 hypothetical protein L598_000800000950 [Mesorhizobium sp. J18]
MLARPEKHICIECGKTFGRPDFAYYHGDIAQGPAYWSDRGILCSAHCSIEHYKKRAAEGTAPQYPAPDPFEDASLEPFFFSRFSK